MEKELINFIKQNELSPFNYYKTSLKPNPNSIYKTRDAKAIHNKILQKISTNFIFPDTSNLLQHFKFTNIPEEISKRQEFFNQIKQIEKINNDFLKFISKPKSNWKPPYDVIVVTENSQTFGQLKEMGCPVQLIISQTDVMSLEDYDLVQVIDSDEYGRALEDLPQTIFLKNIDEVYLERFLEQLASWEQNIEILKQNPLSQDLKNIIQELIPLQKLIKEQNCETLTIEAVEEKVDLINDEVNEKLKELTISGESLVAMLSKGLLPEQIKQTIHEAIKKQNIPMDVLNLNIPVSIDHPELEKQIQRQSANQYSNIAEEIKSFSDSLKEIPERLKQLSELLLIFDFVAGVSQFIQNEMNFPQHSEELNFSNALNLLIENPHPISFNLNSQNKCSILTGANSGGKTTLIEHILQTISLHQIGLPAHGQIQLPLFEEIYYFAKNKGSASKGAFETLLTQMSQIKPGNKTLILADEIEAVTEPGVAGKIITATADYYIKQNCFLVIATHLGYEIQKSLPQLTRIDGIEAQGLDKDYNLIVNHNPVLGRIANSTPELIVEKMANSKTTDYFTHLHNYLKTYKQN
jgi:DNA mismatch repair protein MutS2